MIDLSNMRFTVVGAARSGIAAAKLICELGGEVFLSESRNEINIPEWKALLDRYNVQYETGGHTERAVECDVLIVSPGVPGTLGIIRSAENQGSQIWSEIELAYRAWNGKIVAVTGSNGKTTTTTMIGEIFNRAGVDVVVAGNIGYAFSEAVLDKPQAEWAVLEVSSFQLERIHKFRPDIAVVTNITPDHLDRYDGKMEMYVDAKRNIVSNMSTEGTLVYNSSDEWTRKRFLGYVKESIPCGEDRENEWCVFIQDMNIVMRASGVEQILVKDYSRLLVKGIHNVMNASMAAAVASLAGIEQRSIDEAIVAFRGVEHRIEYVDTINGVQWYNDSKATNVDSVVIALRSFEKNIVLIAGGRDKGASYSPLRELVQERVDTLVVLGEAAPLIEKELSDCALIVYVKDMAEAVDVAAERVKTNGIVLLSPACSSFDMYDNYEQRGSHFKSLVRAKRQ